MLMKAHKLPWILFITSIFFTSGKLGATERPVRVSSCLDDPEFHSTNIANGLSCKEWGLRGCKGPSVDVAQILLHCQKSCRGCADKKPIRTSTTSRGVAIDTGNTTCNSTLPRIAFAINVHSKETFEAMETLIDALYDPEHLFLVHVDTKFSFSARRASAVVAGRENIQLLSLFSLKWGEWSMVQPALSLMTKALNLDAQWDWFIHLSGDSYPVLKPRPLRQRFRDLQGFNFVSASFMPSGLRPMAWDEWDELWFKRMYFPNPLFPQTSLMHYSGSQWIMVSRAFAQFAVESLDEPASVATRFRTMHLARQSKKAKLMPDENFFQTVLMGSPEFRRTCPPRALGRPHGTAHAFNMTASLFLRMDEHYPWNWGTQRFESDVHSTRRWGPYYLGVFDLRAIRQSGALFIRRVSRNVEPNILHLLPADSHAAIPDIGWPSGYGIAVQKRQVPDLTPVPDTRHTRNGCVLDRSWGKDGKVVCQPSHHMHEGDCVGFCSDET